MSEEWKIVQGLKRANQNNSFGTDRGYRETGEKREYKPRKLTRRELRDKKWKEFSSDFYFEEEDEKENIEELKSYIIECKRSGNPVSMKIGEMKITIDERNPAKVDFTSIGNINHRDTETSQYPYRITINGEDMYSEIDIVDDELRASYREKGKPTTKLNLYRTVTVINGEEINEIFSVKPIKGQGLEKDEIVQGLLKIYPEYSEGQKGEMFREITDFDEEIKQIVESDEVLRQYLIPGPRTKLGDFPPGLYEDYLDYNEHNKYFSKSWSIEEARKRVKTYGDGVDIAKKIEEHCKYVYSLLVQAYKELETGVKAPNTERTKQKKQTDETSELNMHNEELNANEETNQVSVNEDMSIEEMQKAVEENERTITQNEETIRQELFKRLAEQERIIAEQQEEINRLRKFLGTQEQ